MGVDCRLSSQGSKPDNQCTKITINCFSCKFVSLTAILQLSNAVSLDNVKIHDSSYKSKFTLPAHIHVYFDAQLFWLKSSNFNMLICEIITQQKGRSVVASKQYFVCVRSVLKTRLRNTLT